MNAKNLLNTLTRIAAAGVDLSTLRVVVMVHQPGTLGALPTVDVSGTQQGIDWDSGRLLMATDPPVSRLDPEQARSITQSVREGGSWKAYQRHKEHERLKAENAALRTAVESQGAGAAAAVEVMRLLSTGEWTLTRHAADPDMTDEYNEENAWSVQRACAPFCDRESNRFWGGATALSAFEKARTALGL